MPSDYGDFLSGIEQHEKRDASWHNSEFFHEKTNAIKTILEKFGFTEGAYRPFFIAHVLLELGLDRQLLNMDPTTCEKMYNMLDEVDKGFVMNIFKSSELAEKMWHFHQRLTHYRYVFEYTEDDRFFYAINRLMERAAQPGMNLSKESMQEFMHNLDELLRDGMQRIFNNCVNGDFPQSFE